MLINDYLIDKKAGKVFINNLIRRYNMLRPEIPTREERSKRHGLLAPGTAEFNSYVENTNNLKRRITLEMKKEKGTIVKKVIGKKNRKEQK